MTLPALFTWPVIGLVAMFSSPASAAGPARVRVALDTIVSADGSHRSAQAAADLGAAVQARSDADGRFEFVERAELEKTAQELQLALSGPRDGASSMQRGRWLKADWTVAGTIAADRAGASRRLELELTDLDRAEILGMTNVALGSTTSGPFALTGTDVETAAAALSGLLQAGALRRSSRDPRPTAALLFLWPEQGTAPVPDLVERLRTELGSGPGDPVRVVRHARAGRSEEESSLVLSGMAETDPALWLKVSDFYIWGTYNVVADPAGTKRDRMSKVGSRITVWDGRGAPVVVTVAPAAGVPADQVPALLAGAIRPQLARRPTGQPSESVRKEISATLMSAVEGELRSARYLSLEQADGVSLWSRCVQALETALFFDPDNRHAREWRARLRWHTAAEHMNKNGFVFARGAFSAWSGYLDRHGEAVASTNYPACLIGHGSRPVTKCWLESAKEMLRLTELVEGKGERGVPDDVDTATMHRWHGEVMQAVLEKVPFLASASGAQDELPDLVYLFLEELVLDKMLTPGQERSYLDAAATLWRACLKVRRHVATISPPEWPTLHRWLVMASEKQGRPGLGSRLQAEWTAAAQSFHGEKASASAPVRTSPTNRPTRIVLPRVNVLDEAEGKTLLSVGGLDLTVPRAAVVAVPVPFPDADDVSSVDALALAGGRIWLAAVAREARQVAVEEGTAGRDLKPRDTAVRRLWSTDPSGAPPRRVAGALATNEVNDLLGSGDKVWIASADSGVASLDVGSGETRWFSEADGRPPGSRFRLAAGPGGVYATGPDLARVEEEKGRLATVPVPSPVAHPLTETDIRLAGNGRNLFVADGAVMGLGGDKGTWTRRDGPVRSVLPEMTWLPVEAMAVADDGELWLGSRFGLHRIDASGGTRRWRQVIRPSVTRAVQPWLFGSSRPVPSVVANVPDPVVVRALDAAWRARADEDGKLVPSGRLPGRVTAIAADAAFVWVAAQETGSRWESRICLLHRASGRWVASFTLPLVVKTLLPTPETLWVGGGRSGPKSASLYRIAKRSLLATPTDRWVGDPVSAAELSTATAGLSPEEKAVVALFSGDAAKVRALLGARPVEEQGAEVVALLAAANDRFGSADAVAQRTHEDHLLLSYPDSSFAARLRAERGRTAVRERADARRAAGRVIPAPTPAAVAEAFAADYDGDADMRLDEHELALAFELEPSRLPAAWPRIGGTPREEAAAVLHRRSNHPMARAGIHTRELTAAFAVEAPRPLPPKVSLDLLPP